MYRAQIWYTAEEDDYKKGASGTVIKNWKETFQAESLGNLRDIVCFNTFSKYEDIEQDENDNGGDTFNVYSAGYLGDIDDIPATKAEIENWKKGDFRLYVISCRIEVSEITLKKAEL